MDTVKSRMGCGVFSEAMSLEIGIGESTLSLISFLAENADVREYFRTAFQKPTIGDVRKAELRRISCFSRRLPPGADTRPS